MAAKLSGSDMLTALAVAAQDTGLDTHTAKLGHSILERYDLSGQTFSTLHDAKAAAAATELSTYIYLNPDLRTPQFILITFTEKEESP